MPLISSPLTADFFISWKLRSYEMKNAAPALAFCGYGPEKRKKYGKKKRRTKKHPLEKHPQTGRAACGGGSLPACGGLPEGGGFYAETEIFKVGHLFQR